MASCREYGSEEKMTAKLIVTIVGILLICGVNWYFLFSKKKTKAQKGQS